MRNNVITQTAAALCGLLSVEADSAGGQAVNKFVGAYGQAAADQTANLDAGKKAVSLVSQLGDFVAGAAQKDGWTVSREFVDGFAACVLAVVNGVQLVAPTDGINTKTENASQ